MTAENNPPQPTTIQKLATAVYPSFAMLTGMQLDVFTPLKDDAMTAEELSDFVAVNAARSPFTHEITETRAVIVE